MITLLNHRKKIALVLALLMATELIMPLKAYALTTGPTQPETQGFQPIGTSDMVNLFTGDFSYDIPLLKVGEYPVNLSYHSGANLDDEASWVGYGWSLSPGVMNRQLRGLPDDFNGKDTLTKQVSMKEHTTKGASLSLTLDALGIPLKNIKIGKKKKQKSLSMSPTLTVGVNFDNYRGVGVDIGFNAGLKVTKPVTGTLTHCDGSEEKVFLGNESKDIGDLNLGLSSFDGASLSASGNFNVMQKKNDKDEVSKLSSSIGFGYNSRQGLKQLTLRSSYSFTSKEPSVGNRLLEKLSSAGNSSISFAGDSYTPTIENPTSFTSFTFTLHTGAQLFLGFPGFGGTGFYNKQKIDPKLRSVPMYGFMHADKGKDNVDALMDFNREKDIPYNTAINYLPIPVPTYDLFTASSQGGGGQYRLYRGSTGVFFDNKVSNKSSNTTLGVEFGAGFFVIGGFDVYHQDAKTITQKWQHKNYYLTHGDFQKGNSPLYEAAYFKQVGEPVPSDKDYFNKMLKTGPVAVKLQKNVIDPLSGAEAMGRLRTLANANGQSVSSPIRRNKREVRNNALSYLTATEAAQHGLDKTIQDYHPDSVNFGGCTSGYIRTNISRTSSYHRPGHVSEFTITAEDGGRTVYGIPTYNTYQEDVTFSIGKNHSVRNKGIINYTATDASTANNNGLHNYYSKEITPPYATSYLLTGMLSPDYVDRTGNGITDDDAGTAVKFNYTRLTDDFRWRTPYAYGADSANYNENFLSDERDDKANYVYGKKEIWYLHSIESKTMVAHFITGNRDDGLGVLNAAGGKNTSLKLKYLKEIRLYSKSDLNEHNGNVSQVLPIKVIEFDYKYQVCKNLPNSDNGGGKLTLSKVTIINQGNAKGKLSPYQFSYDTSSYNYYDYRQYDRWGNFKDAAYNPGGMNNSEYPYTPQDTALANKFASVGQLTRIDLPSGGVISVDYEADDYAYVQDKRASVMCQVSGIGTLGSSTGITSADKIYIDLPDAVATTAQMKYKYFEDMEYLYFKFFLNLDNKGHSEFVPGYAKIKSVARYNDTTAEVTLERVQGTPAIAKAGWQFIRINLPKWAYPGSDNYGDNGSDLVKAIKALVTALKSITEMFKDFDKKAKTRGYSNNTTLNKSWVRLCAPKLMKKGGGSRVRSITMSDEWAAMSATSGALTGRFTQLYTYTTKDKKGNTISSGVASYEPMLGNDENPFRQPIAYTQNHVLGLDDYCYIERPLGESFFPGPSVGYSRVSVKSIGTGDAESVNRTGESISEFYTARDYPTLLSETTLEKSKPVANLIMKLIGGISVDNKGLSQGYQVETNDMHGKPKSVNIFNKSGQNVSSVEYSYKTVNELAPRKQLSNDVKVIDSTGVVTDAVVGMEAEMFTDMRQQTTDNLGKSLKFSGGAGAFFIFPLPFFFPGIGANYDTRNYRSSSTIKLINRFAIQYKTKKVENGSSITSENLLWDAETGNVLLTKTQNEFDDPIYSFAYPAHWMYGGMGQAYKNLGTLLTGFSTNSNGVPTNGTYNSILVPGDELIDVGSANKYWVINSPISGTYQNRLIDEQGAIKQVSNLTVKLVRSGRRNMANTGVASITSLNNPIVGDRLSVSQVTKILDAKAIVFKEEWSVPVPSVPDYTEGPCAQIDGDCRSSLYYNLFQMYDPIGKPLVFASQADGVFLDSLGPSCMDDFMSAFYDGNDSIPFYLYNADVTPPYTLNSHDSIRIGNCRIYFDTVTPLFNTVIDSVYDGYTINISTTYDEEGCSASLVYCPTFPGPCDTIAKFRLSCPGFTCTDPVSNVINPYFAGIKGNWRPLGQYAYHVARENYESDPAKKGSTDIRRSGAYSVFNPFWKRNTIWEKNPTNDIRWIAANEVTYFNTKGSEIENKDALNRYSSAMFGYLESVPIAVASNTRYRELAYDGFEDYNFRVGCVSNPCYQGHFDFKSLLDESYLELTKRRAHTGNYSLYVEDNSTVTLQKSVFTGDPANLYTFDGSGRYFLGANELNKGFSPIPGKKYVFSCWIYDSAKRDPTTDILISANGVNLVSGSANWPIVEGWKHIQAQFTLPSLSTDFYLQLFTASNGVYFDDIRIHPFDGQMKSFAYDASTQRLMAELDENNFATFYEYNDEGTLIRVKKESEKGILTIRETRSSMRKQY